ncbi:unnamed protein product [Cylindrotheca closterium]|uniref:Protein kinase domain-containing protein n=1 Tax=Cylindrotheca closterium TaxID=2856 RepID=A0AAD2CQN0_9STRA|nr:unnamed protein product [Cylindrotheca closterium]
MDIEGAASNGRRRRRARANDTPSGIQCSPVPNGDYFDDSDEEKDKTYDGACAMGQFFLNPCLCIFMSVRYLRRRCSHRKNQSSHQAISKEVEIWDVLYIIVGTILVYFCLLFFARRRRHGGSSIRPATDSDLGRMNIRIPNLDIGASKIDVGGWLFFRQFAMPSTPIDPTQPNRLFDFEGKFGDARKILSSDEKAAKKNWNEKILSKKSLRKYYEFSADLEDQENECRRPNWTHLYKPNCNSMHEIDILADFPSGRTRLKDFQDLDSFYISHGYFRDVWVVDSQDRGEKTILKVSRWRHDYGVDLLHEIMRDALIMERMSMSPRIVDMYGHCGSAVQVEAIPYEIEEVIVPGDGYAKAGDLRDELDVRPQNQYTATEKLEMALEMAESLADLHGFADGIIVHDDVQLCQWLRTKDGFLKLGDFNRAEVMNFNSTSGEYCKYQNGPGFGNYRSPEEFADMPLNEKIDIWSFGNNIYALLTGLWVFYENEDDEVVHKQLIDGKTSFIDPRYKRRSYPESQLVKLLEQCWQYNPDDRPSIFELIDQLRNAVSENIRLKGPGMDEAPPLDTD